MNALGRGVPPPRVTVITPVYNGARHIAACIASVRAQTYTAWEHVVVDNHSTDGTADIVRAEAARDPRLRYVRTGRHHPIIDNWNASLREMDPASAYCKVVHADDVLFPECLERMVAVGERHPRAGIIGAYVLQDTRVMCDGLPWPEECFSGRELAAATLAGALYVFGTPTSTLLRAELLREQQPFYDSRYLHADAAACLRTLEHWDFGYVHQTLTYTRLHGDSVTERVSRPANTRAIEWLLMLEEFGPRFLDPIELAHARRLRERQFYRALAMAGRRRGARAARRGAGERLAQWGVRYRGGKFLDAMARLEVERALKSALRRVSPATHARLSAVVSGQPAPPPGWCPAPADTATERVAEPGLRP